jgi:hypothetical protein
MRVRKKDARRSLCLAVHLSLCSFNLKIATILSGYEPKFDHRSKHRTLSLLRGFRMNLGLDCADETRR